MHRLHAGAPRGVGALCLGRAPRHPGATRLNDAHAALLGEVWLGAAKGCADAFMLTLGTGVGGAAVCGGRLLRGAIGRAGHLGHIALDFQGEGDICGTPGSLEDMIGECSLPRRSGGRFAATADLVAAAASGDAEAAEIWARSVRALAAGIASLINVLDPEAVVIGGGIAAAGDALFAPLRQHLARFEWRPAGRTVPLRAAQLGDWAGCAGAVRFAASRPEIG
ncbi:MAG: ROK family protein [Verrucomicrobiales bacterium]